MWKNKLGNICAYVLSGLFVTIFLVVIVSGMFFGFFLFARTAFAVDSSQAAELINQQCLQCHGEKGFTVQRDGKNISLFVSEATYKESVHGTNACTTCHPGMEKDMPHKSAVYGQALQQKVLQECEACHDKVTKDYRTSVHGKLASAGKETAYCGDCHGSHNVLKKENPEAIYYRLNISDTCANCHDGKVMDTYKYSFHGTAVNFGYTKAATCADCHGNHTILAAEDPQSMVSAQNRPETCAQCHFFARDGFAKGMEHVTPQDKKAALPLYIVWKIFIVLIIFDFAKDGSIVIFELIRQLRGVNEVKKHTKSKDTGLNA
ncbi:hypothetical protein MFMK1_002259 [Metallumcola ferriviriculae]|uniref:Doubled CXXCH motif domain-containing protein n=1 Tax=Metallumcola ferriviriculae TaxID=3039180 RepID=A0AAU0UQF9_9FIRM|nr:hypothetical protein MFMK1_002259 [Desulfitibacteraceae bacterium MK1]